MRAGVRGGSRDAEDVILAMRKETEAGGDVWPEGYFEIFAAQPDVPIERGPQGEFEERLAASGRAS